MLYMEKATFQKNKHIKLDFWIIMPLKILTLLPRIVKVDRFLPSAVESLKILTLIHILLITGKLYLQFFRENHCMFFLIV